MIKHCKIFWIVIWTCKFMFFRVFNRLCCNGHWREKQIRKPWCSVSIVRVQFYVDVSSFPCVFWCVSEKDRQSLYLKYILGFQLKVVAVSLPSWRILHSFCHRTNTVLHINVRGVNFKKCSVKYISTLVIFAWLFSSVVSILIYEKENELCALDTLWCVSFK